MCCWWWAAKWSAQGVLTRLLRPMRPTRCVLPDGSCVVSSRCVLCSAKSVMDLSPCLLLWASVCLCMCVCTRLPSAKHPITGVCCLQDIPE